MTKQTYKAEITYFSGEKKSFDTLTAREARRVYNATVRDMAINGVKRVSYGVV